LAEQRTKNDPDVLHRLKNDLAIVIGFCDLLVAECPADDPRRADLIEVNRAAQHALTLMPEVARLAGLRNE
jgi:hypothetical protein